jgi:hypothetical protein
LTHLSKQQIENILDCDFERGVLLWKWRPEVSKTWNTRFAGKEALNSISIYGYKRGHLAGRHAFAHRVIWFLAHGEWPTEIDHINGIKTDNRLCNLRNVSRGENMKNICRPKDNKTGVPGLKLDKRTGKWVAAIGFNGRMKHIGVFDSFEDAKRARLDAEVLAGYHPNHGRENKTCTG